MLRVKLQYFGHLMQRANLLEKTPMQRYLTCVVPVFLQEEEIVAAKVRGQQGRGEARPQEGSWKVSSWLV